MLSQTRTKLTFGLSYTIYSILHILYTRDHSHFTERTQKNASKFIHYFL